jgi:hypothetical protein
VNRAWWIAVARLTGLLVCVGLATTRIGLLAHELVGHGGATLAVGGTVTEVHLFYFAGGWVRYNASGGGLVIAMGGIAVELVAGAALWLVFLRKDALGHRIVRALGAALVLHATWYLATGTWHGYGDGIALHRELGDAAWLVAVPAAAITLGAAYLGARTVLGPLAATIPTRRLAGTAIAVVLAGGLQAGLAVGEVVVRRDAAYSSMMKPERERRIGIDLARWEAQQATRPTDEARAEMERRLAAAHPKTFPFAILLGVLTVLAIGAGAWRSRGADGGPIAHRLLVRAALAAAGSVALVIAIDAAFH